jgi:hypothetical protein
MLAKEGKQELSVDANTYLRAALAKPPRERTKTHINALVYWTATHFEFFQVLFFDIFVRCY